MVPSLRRLTSMMCSAGYKEDDVSLFGEARTDNGDVGQVRALQDAEVVLKLWSAEDHCDCAIS